MGLLADQDGILRRYQNETENWQEHLSNTKHTIINFIDEKKPKSVSILGSGWMLDLPVTYLADNLESVVFYDIRHPAAVIDKCRKYSNFHFFETDLTGGMIALSYHLCHRKDKPTISMLQQVLLQTRTVLPFDTDCYISVNLLNQLDIIIIDYLEKFFNLTVEDNQQIRRIIQSAHIDFLKQHNYCLISDIEEIHLDADDNIVGNTTLVYSELPVGNNEKSWIWSFDTKKSYHNDKKTYMKVKAIF